MSTLNLNNRVGCMELWDVGNELSAEVAAQLGTNTTLTSLSLMASPSAWMGGGNRITALGAEALGQALIINTTLNRLNLLGNQVGPQGSESLSNALVVNSTLERLDLGGNAIGDEGARHLATALGVNSTLMTLILGGNNSITLTGIGALADALVINTSLRTLDLGVGNEGAESIGRSLAHNSTLINLSLQGHWYSVDDQRIEARGAQALATALFANSSLQYLDLSCNEIDNEGAQALATALFTNRTLTHLDLKANDSISTAGKAAFIPVFAVNETLLRLCLTYHRGETGIRETLLSFCDRNLSNKKNREVSLFALLKNLINIH